VNQDDAFLIELYDRLHETPTHRKLRKLAPVPVGVVFIQWPGIAMGDIRGHFRLMRELGFTCLKGLYLLPGTDRRAVMHAALDEGIIPWWYGEAGWEEPTTELLAKLDIPAETTVPELRRDPRFLAHQDRAMRERIDRETGPAPSEPGMSAGGGAEHLTYDADLSEEVVPRFVEWLRGAYGSPAEAAEAWNITRDPFGGGAPGESWDDVARDFSRPGHKEYRRIRDVLRFKADARLEEIRAKASRARETDPHAPFRAGGEMGIFLPHAARAVDMEGIADAMADFGSFYPSIHLAWHFEEVAFEVARPVYMQAAYAADIFKGGWSATWESTGGPQQLSGGKAHLFPAAAGSVAGFTVDEGVITQLMLSYLAAGFRGFGFWCWNARTFGWEAGEYALLDRQNRPTERAIQAGRIGRAARRWRDELWLARKEPTVGVYTDFENDCVWAAVAVGGRDLFKNVPAFARIGAARALINANVPFEHVTGADLRAGLAGRYRVILLPAAIRLDGEFLGILEAYTRSGGRVVVDMPSAWYDGHGRLLATREGSPFERLFGCTVRDMQYSSNVPRRLDAALLEGFVADLEPTRARAVATFESSAPAVTEAACGSGSAVVAGFEASLACRAPGDARAEARLVSLALGGLEPPYSCDGAVAYRLAAPVDLPAHDGRWLRCAKA
jgi:beta-galactosidase